MAYTKPTLAEFISTLTPDILSAATFIDWKRIETFLHEYRRELALLGSLSKDDPLADLADLLLQHPTTLKLLQTLIAHGSDSLQLADTLAIGFDEGLGRLKSKDHKYARDLAEAFRAVGLVPQLQVMKSVLDYSKGTLVGLEPNKRKNRRGDVFQNVVIPKVLDQTLRELNEQFELGLTVQRGARSDITISVNGKTKHPDFAIFAEQGNKPAIAMEVNFYSASGSKPSETLTRAYPDVQETLREDNMALIVITDGIGWKKMRGALKEALERLDYLMNYELAGGGRLSAAILDALGTP